MRRVLGTIFLLSFLLFFIGNVDANIVLKLLIVNSSDEQSQILPIKVYLPKETKPEDVIDKGDLEVGYDTQQGSYYVYGQYELQPSEVLEKEVELRDIWIIPTAEIESIGQEADKVNDLLKNTEFGDRIKFLYSTINKKLALIQKQQDISQPNPEDHISQYRDNMKLIESVKIDLAVARSMLNKAKPFSTKAVWKIMVFILIFLGVLTASFYFLWFKQTKLFGTESLPKQEPEPEAEVEGEEKTKETEEGSEEDSNDIEKIIRGE